MILIGFMGTGKTSVGIELAGLTGRELVDIDNEIVRRQGRSITSIFKIFGEDYFRELESDIITNMESLSAEPAVISTGGGVVLREKNRRELRRQGVVVLLTATPEEILKRTRGGERPLLDHPRPKERIKELLAQREELYRSTCHLEVDTVGKKQRKIAEEICSQLEQF